MKTLRIRYPVCLLCTVLALLTLFALAGGALAEESGTCGKDLTWTLQNDTLTISGNGEMQDYEYIEVSQDVLGIHFITFTWDPDGEIFEIPYTTAPWGELQFSRVIVEEGVTRVGACAFYGCLGLTDVSLPDSLVSLGSEAFGECLYLSTIKLPDSLTTIGEKAFSDMGLMATEEEGRPVEITLPNSMTSIDKSAFRNSCIESIILPDSITSIGEEAFEGCDLSYIVLPDSVASIGKFAFAYCYDLADIALPDSVTSIGAYAFANCWELSDITLPDSITSIGEKAFADCRNLFNITLPESLVFIGEQAFDEAVVLTVAEGSYAEEYCKSLEYRYAYEGGIMAANTAPISLKLDESGTLTVSGTGKLNRDVIEVYDVETGNTVLRSWNEAIVHVSHVIVEEGITSVEDNVFEKSSITDVTLPDSVTSIGNMAFSYCDLLESINLPESLSMIGDSAFYDTTLFTVSPGSYAENYCRIHGYHFIYSNGTTPEGLSSIALKLDENGTLTISGSGMLKRFNVEAYDKKTGGYTLCSWKQIREEIVHVIVEDGITSIGENAFEYCYSLTDVILPDSVSSIGPYAFEQCLCLTDINLPDSVTFIGEYAFQYCRELKSIDLPKTLTSIENFTFDGTGLTSIKLPDSIRSIGFAAFSNCSALKNVDLPNDLPEAVISISNQAFEGCTGLTEVYLPPAVSDIGFNAFLDSTTLSVIKGSYAEEYCLVNRHAMGYVDGVLPEGYTFAHIMRWDLDENGVLSIFGTGKMEDLALNWAMAPWYESKDKIVRVVINEGITNIAPRAFSGCSNLTEITIPQSVTVIGRYAFQGCQKLQSIDLHAGITSIEESVFDYCPISKVTVEKGSYAERYCVYRNIPVMHKGEKKASVISQDKYRMCGENLKWSVNNGTLTISGEGEMDDFEEWCYVNAAKAYRPSFWGKSKFSGVDMKPGITNIVDCAFYDRSDLKKVTLPDTVTSIGKKAFQGCGLQEIILPDSIVSIGELAFGECSLQSVILPGNLASIDRSAFTSCTHLKEIELPESLTAIGEYAFSYCTHLKTINLPNSITSIGADAFTGCYSLTIYVDKGSYAETYCKENGLSFSYTE